MTSTHGATDRRWIRAAFAAALGVLHASSFAPPLGAWWLQLLALAALVPLLRPTPWLPAFAFGLGGFATGLSWLHTSMHVYGGMPSPLAVLAVLAFSAYLALFPAAAAWLGSRVIPPGARGGDVSSIRSDVAGALALAGAWCAAELARGWLFTGFPWLSVGYAHIDGPLSGLAPWTGVYGVGAAAVFVAALLASSASALRRVAMVPALALVALASAVLGGAAALGRIALTAPDGAPVAVRLVQGNVPQQLKFDPMRALRAMEDYVRLAEGASAPLVVFPETAWTVPWSSTPPELSARLAALSRRTGAALAIGMPLPPAAPDGGNVRITNSVALLAPSRADAPDVLVATARYDKQHLVPFGEFIPLGFAWFVRLMNIPLGEFGRGAPGQAPFAIAGQRFAFDVCYEDLFGEQIAAQVRAGASVLVNVSNIAWFGESHALPQHLAIARMRTLETGRPMLRATNTGVTASIDHRGRVLGALPVHAQAALDTTVRGTSGLTPYVRFGNLLPGAIALLLLGAARVVARRHSRGNR